MALVTSIDFITIPSTDFGRAVRFYEETLEMRRTMYSDRGFAEFEADGITLAVVDASLMPGGFVRNTNPVALRVDDVHEARAGLEARGVEFSPDIIDSGVCHMAIFRDSEGNALMLHKRYAPREH